MLHTPHRLDQRITPHRSLYRLSFPWVRLAVVLLLPLAFNIATWGMGTPISAGWRAFFAFWIDKLDLPGVVTLRQVGPAWLRVVLPSLEFPSRAPDPFTWWATLIVTLLVLLLLPSISKWLLPLCYLLGFIVFIQMTALVFFAIGPAVFPYTVTDYLQGAQVTGIWFLLIVPWVHALIYYIFDFSLLKKVWLTFLTLVFLALALPCQIMVHAYLLVHFSLLFLPVLYFVFGVLFLILGCIALYGWAMSWLRTPSASLPTDG